MYNDAVWDQLFAEIAAIQLLASSAIQRLLPKPLTLAGFGVLDRIARLPGPWTPSRLASAAQVTKGAITSTLHRLAAAGHIVIAAAPGDARARHIGITPAGLAARDAALAAVAAHTAALTAALPRHQARVVLPLLEQLRIWLDKNRPAPHSGAHD